MMRKVVLDASALLALLQQEKGAELVASTVKYALISTVNLTEVLTTLQKIDISSEEALEDIKALVGDIEPFSCGQADLAACLNKRTRHLGLSLGDRACLALALDKGLPVFTADKIWKELDIEDLKIQLIR